MNDLDDRLYRFTQAGWEFVTDKNLEVGDPSVNADKELGSVIVKPVGNGIEAFLMCIEEEFYNEDQAAKAAKIDETERAMKEELNSSRDGRYGGVEISRI